MNNLVTLNCENNNLTSLDVSNKIFLKSFNCSDNSINNLNISNCMALESMKCSLNQLTTLDISNRPNLLILECFSNLISNLNITNDLALLTLYIGDNQLTSINLDPFVNIDSLSLGANPYSSAVNLSTLVNLETMFAQGITNPSVFPLTNSVMPLLVNLKILKTDNSSIGNINYSLIPNLETLLCRYTGLTNINNIPTDLINFVCEGNSLTSLDLSPFTNLVTINCAYNPITSITFGNQSILQNIFASGMNVPNIDLSNLPLLQQVNVNNTPSLISLNVKNGLSGFNSIFGCPNLQYICADEGEITNIQNAITTNNYTNCHVNTYCTFNPGGTFYTMQGNHRWDTNNNGCDTSDFLFPNLKFTISNGTTNTTLISGNNGSYRYDVPAGTYTITPVLENPSYFTYTSSNTGNIVFPTVTSPYIRDFCIQAVANNPDLEVALYPLSTPRPGFNNRFTLVYKNKGGTPQNGTVNFTFNDAVQDLVSSSVAPTSQSTGNLNWNFINLLPFETKTVTLTFLLNTPQSTPALVSGDNLNYNASMTGNFTDILPVDNVATINQTVVDSYDPNDKTCVEGTVVGPTVAGKYVHYVIRFENTGTANAINVVVRDIIDTAKFDISTLIPQSGSHPYTTRIINTNQVEFIFQNINLPFDDANNDGYIAFKIKVKPTLVVGDTFSNSANIYFDYNFPIVTNNYVTTIQTLGLNETTAENKLSVYPNPVRDIIHFKSQENILKVEVYDISGRILSSNTVHDNKLNLGSLGTGNYILKVYTESGFVNTKIIKE
jgi:hypothetical protein